MTAVVTSMRSMDKADWPRVEAIYREGIATGHATFEERPPVSWEAFIATRLAPHCLVVVDPAGEVLGWAAASGVSDRCAYAGVVEHSVYVTSHAQGAGVGAALLSALVDSTEGAGIWTIQSGIFPANTPSLALHQHAGFRVVGRRERLGLMTYGPCAGQWRDVVLVERRSDRVS